MIDFSEALGFFVRVVIRGEKYSVNFSGSFKMDSPVVMLRIHHLIN